MAVWRHKGGGETVRGVGDGDMLGPRARRQGDARVACSSSSMGGVLLLHLSILATMMRTDVLLEPNLASWGRQLCAQVPAPLM
uniref:Uncharacterized protein n=1 Tax=Oryza glumipatula TaxID=40148 RepID=A0A0E0AB60_9ORYZ